MQPVYLIIKFPAKHYPCQRAVVTKLWFKKCIHYLHFFRQVHVWGYCQQNTNFSICFSVWSSNFKSLLMWFLFFVPRWRHQNYWKLKIFIAAMLIHKQSTIARQTTDSGQWKITCTKITNIFVMNYYGPFVFKWNARNNIRRRNLKWRI